MSAVQEPHIVLIGMMGAGKTTTARALARRLGWPLEDCDATLEQRHGSTGAAIAQRDGVPHLHALEADILLAAIGREQPTIITAAGSVVTSTAVRTALPQRALVVWLDAPLEQLRGRAATSDHRRALAPDAARRLASERVPLMAALADLQLDARSPTDSLVEQILTAVPSRDGTDRHGADAAPWTPPSEP